MLKKLYELDCINLEKLLLSKYAKLKLNEKEFIILLQLIKNNKLISSLDLEELKKTTGFTLDDISITLDSLLKKEYISLEITVIRNRECEIVKIDDTFKKLEAVLDDEKQEVKVKMNKDEIKLVIETLEKEFGRLLSPLELEIVKEWFSNKIDCDDILYAIKEAVKNNRCTLKYIDGIIVNKIKNKKSNIINYERDEHFDKQIQDLFSTFKR